MTTSTLTSSLAALNWADYTIIAIILSSTLLSLARGFVREFLSIVIWILAFWVAFQFEDSLATWFTPYISTVSLRIIVSFLILFVITLMVGSLINFSISKLLATTGFGGVDKLLGMVFGLARGILLVGIILLLASFTAFTQDQWWINSILISYFKPLVVWLNSFLPDKIEHLSHMVQQQIVTGIDTIKK